MLIFKAVLITKCRSLRRLDAREGEPVHGLANQEHLIMCVFANTAAVTNADSRRFSSTMLLQSYIYTSLKSIDVWPVVVFVVGGWTNQSQSAAIPISGRT